MDQSTLLSLFTRFDDDPPQQPDLQHGPATTISNISGIGILKKGQQFSIFKKKHGEEAAAAYNFLLSSDSNDEFVSKALQLKQILNEGIYLYVISVAVAHRDVEAQMPPLWEIHPKSFFRQPDIKHAIYLSSRKGRDAPDAKSRAAPLNFVTGTNRDLEFRMAWWREDCELNAHHWHWHQVYPWMGVKDKNTGTYKTKDRQGELFYYMHQQMLARYDAERLGVGLMRVDQYNNWHLPITEGYNSQLTDYYGSQGYPARPTGMILADNWRDPDSPSLVNVQQYSTYRLLDAINTGKFVKSDEQNQDMLVDIVSLGAAVESSISSPNPDLYGSVHNLGHDLLAAITDPDGRYQQAGGVMGDTATAIRDPIFFRWHKFIDNLFLLHKIKLDPYTDKELEFSDVSITALKVTPDVGSVTHTTDVLTTYMEDVVVNISHDMFYTQNEIDENTDVSVTVKQVNHDKFKYTISLNSKAAKKVQAAIRIFMAPSVDEHGNSYEMSMQRRLFIEMDKFVQELTPGTNTIERSSTASSVIKPPGPTFKQLQNLPAATGNKNSECPCRKNRYCECGWPEHMLLPRGTPSGMKFDLFVMVTDWSNDSVNNLDQGTSYCGVKDDKYPDKCAMGFPFDRKILEGTLKEFTDRLGNMMTMPITIKWNVE